MPRHGDTRKQGTRVQRYCEPCGDWHTDVCPLPGEIKERSGAVRDEWTPQQERVRRGGTYEHWQFPFVVEDDLTPE